MALFRVTTLVNTDRVNAKVFFVPTGGLGLKN
jgi:hypothetical protein